MHTMNRRTFLVRAGVAAAGLGMAWTQALAQRPPRRLVVLFLRGGLDGLSALVPYEDRAYYQARPSTALPPPGHEGGVLPLASGFGLHPALEPLLELWREPALAIIPSCGLPVPIRTHPEAQKAMESGQPGERHYRDGWMARLAPLLGKDVTGITLCANPTLIGQGAKSIQNIRPSGYPPSIWKLERPPIYSAYDAIYQGNDALGRAYRQAQIALKNKLTELDREIAVSASGAPSIHALPVMAGQIASFLEKAPPSARLVFAALGGLDAHFQQGAATGRQAEAFVSLGKGLASLAKALGPNLAHTCVVVMSEFGRSLRENEFGGTENGHGTVCMVLGGGVAGGVRGPWPGLAPEKLSDGLDLAASVDFREVIAQVCSSHLEISREQLAQVLPGYAPTGLLKDMFKV